MHVRLFGENIWTIGVNVIEESMTQTSCWCKCCPGANVVLTQMLRSCKFDKNLQKLLKGGNEEFLPTFGVEMPSVGNMRRTTFYVVE